jgi:hypothetical protein
MEPNQQQDQSQDQMKDKNTSLATSASSSKKWIYITLLLLILLIALIILITRSCGKPKDPDSSGVSSSPAESTALTSSPISTSSADTAVGTVIQLGKYEQDNNIDNGKEPIDWVVLAVEDDRMLLTSVYALELMPYNNSHTHTTWETATLRSWLNEEFFENAFSNEEKAGIQTTQIDNNDSVTNYSVNPGGNDTLDKVFLLSIYEARKYIPGDAALNTPVTAYLSAKAAGFLYEDEDGRESAFWWSRSIGAGAFPPGEYYASVFSSAGTFSRQVDNSTICVRPAIWIRSDTP